MKRTKTKLHLGTETVKVLRDASLERVVGAGSMMPHTYANGCTLGDTCPYTGATVCIGNSCLTVHNCVKG